MTWKEITILITVMLAAFAFVGILYDAWSGMKNAGTNSELKREIKKDMVRNIVFGAVILIVIVGVESMTFYLIMG